MLACFVDATAQAAIRHQGEGTDTPASASKSPRIVPAVGEKYLARCAVVVVAPMLPSPPQHRGVQWIPLTAATLLHAGWFPQALRSTTMAVLSLPQLREGRRILTAATPRLGGRALPGRRQISNDRDRDRSTFPSARCRRRRGLRGHHTRLLGIWARDEVGPRVWRGLCLEGVLRLIAGGRARVARVII